MFSIDFTQSIFAVPVLSFLLMLVLVPIAVLGAHHFDFLDHPEGEEGRKQHLVAVPPIGGILMFLVFFVALIYAGFDLLSYWPVLSALFLVVVTGAIDDRYFIHAYIKLAVQVSATLLLIFPGGAVVGGLGDMFGFGNVELPVWFSYLFSFAAVLLLINSINLADGLDGLAGGKCLVILGWLLFAAFREEHMDLMLMMMILVAVLAGFLFYNMRSPWRHRALLFMGDAGSMGLGVLVAFLAVYIGRDTQDGRDVLTPMSVAWIIALPVMDACTQFIRRMVQGKHPFEADRGHLHHIFVDSGVKVSHTVLIIIGICFLFGLFGLSPYFFGMPQVVLTVAWVVVFAIYTVFSIRRIPSL